MKVSELHSPDIAVVVEQKLAQVVNGQNTQARLCLDVHNGADSLVEYCIACIRVGRCVGGHLGEERRKRRKRGMIGV